MSELPREEGGCLGPEAVEKLESYPLSYSEGFCILEAERDRKEVYTEVWMAAKRVRLIVGSRLWVDM